MCYNDYIFHGMKMKPMENIVRHTSVLNGINLVQSLCVLVDNIFSMLHFEVLAHMLILWKQLRKITWGWRKNMGFLLGPFFVGILVIFI